MRKILALIVAAACLSAASAAFADSLVVEGNHKAIRRACNGSTTITILGNHNVLTLTGDCALVQVDGNHNVVKIEGVKRLNVRGNHNMVNWKRGVGGQKALVSNLGTANKVTHTP
ncbi:MAG: DUF3060 domain-containing protein [Myxococcales bacterium]|nr:DUF3060 domain-containing protein [Myxococcales bacterium]